MWHFKETGFDDTIKTSKLAEFFSSKKCEAVVRESIQNSLDASDNNGSPVKVVFTFGRAERSSFPEIYDPLEEHLKITGYNGKFPKNVSFVTIEDFNTNGLQGDLSKFCSPEERSSFYSFWWQEGEGLKKQGSGGSHGVGKSTLSNASTLKSFLALTVRSDSPSHALIGFCDLPPHEVNSCQYLGYARFGHITSCDTRQELLPQTLENNPDVIGKFKKHAGIKRNNENGLSIFIPEINDDFTAAETIKEVIRNYFLPIIKSNLSVEIDDQINPNSCKIHSENIENLVAEFFKEEKQRQELLTLIKVSKAIAENHKNSRYFHNTSNPNREQRKLASEMFSEENLNDMKRDFQSGKVVPIHITFPIQIKNKSQQKSGHLSIYALNEGCKSKYYSAFRGNVLINKEKCSSPCSYTALIVDIDNASANELSEYLKHTEDPGHCEWKGSAATRSKGRYSQTEAWIKTTVQRAASSILNILSDVNENEKIVNFAEDIFYIETPSNEGPSNDNKGSNSKKGKKKTPTLEDPPEKSQPLFSSHRIDQGGIRFSGTQALKDKLHKHPDEGIHGRIRAAHVMPASSKAKWFKEYNPADFSFKSTIDIALEGIEPLETKDNELVFRVISPDFSIGMKGFDTNRDVHFEINKVKEAQNASS